MYKMESEGLMSHERLLEGNVPDCQLASSTFLFNNTLWDFPGGSVVRNPPAEAGDTGSTPAAGRSHKLQRK